MDEIHKKKVLEVPVNERNGKLKQLRFPDKTGDSKSHIHVNYAAYLEYINKNYPDLHTFDIGIDNETGPNREKIQKQLKNDFMLLNQLDIEQYEGLNSPDDIWDSLANSVYGMGFIGRYSRIATSLETGINYIFTFEDFAHIYPFLKSCQGNALLIRRLSGLKDVENKKFSSYKLYYKSQPEHSFGAANSPGVADVELERRSIYNHSFVIKPEFDNPPGTEWSYLSVDKDKVEMGNSYRRGYSYVPDTTPVELDAGLGFRHELGENSPTHETPECAEQPELETEKVLADSSHDNRRYIYEKYLFCTYKWCPGSMRIILDCIHNVVILSMTNPHFDCHESHKRKIYDIVRKLFVLNQGDIDLIDAKYATIPRRYGLAFIESWIHSEEFELARSSEYTPSFQSYNINESDQSKSWASQKNRNWVVDSFYNADSAKSNSTLTINGQGQHKWKATHVKTKQDYVAHPQRLIDLRNYGIEYWDFDIFKYDFFGNVTPRSEWEFHVNRDSDEKNREVFRFWRKQYFGISDFVRQTSNHLSIGKSFGLVSYFMANNGEHTFQKKKVHIYSFGDQLHVKQQGQIKKDFLKDIYLFTRNYDWEKFDSILFKQTSVASTLPNPDLHILPYPLNRQVQKLSETFGEAGLLGDHESQSGCVFVCSSIRTIANSDKVVICERDIKYQDIILEEWRALHRRKSMIHPSDQIWNMEPNFIQALGMMAIYDKQFLKNRHIVDRFNRLRWKSMNDQYYLKTLGDALADEGCKYRSPQINRRRLPAKPVSESEFRYVGFRVLYETNGQVETGYIFCSENKLSSSLKLMLEQRTIQEHLPMVLLVDDSKCNPEQLQEIQDKVKIVQVRSFLFGKLKSLIPFDYLLFLMRALIMENVDMDTGEKLLKKRLPPQRKKDVDFYKLEFEGRRIASNAGLVRIAVQKLCKVNSYLTRYQDAWRIGKRWGSFDLAIRASGEDKWKFLPKSLPNFDNLQFAKMLHEAGRNEKNIQLAEDVESVKLLEWAIECVKSEEQKNSCEELVAGEFRDFFELIKRTTDFV